MNRLTDFLTAPLGGSSKVACFLQGGRYSGDAGSIEPPAAECLYVTPCDCGNGEGSCGSLTHWHELSKLDELGDAPRHGAYYVLVNTQPAPSGMIGALYVSAGFERPTANEMQRARDDFERGLRSKAEISADLDRFNNRKETQK